MIISGVIINQDDYLELEKRDLPFKKTLQQRKNSVFELQSAFDDVADYLTQYETARVTLLNNFQVEVESNYLKILRILRKKRLHVIAGKIKFISIRCLENPKRWHESMHFSDFLISEVSKYGLDVKYYSTGESERLLEVAKILATLEYERLRSLEGEYLQNVVSKKNQSLVQILKMTWNSPPIEEYCDDDVGMPAVVVRRPDSLPIEFVYIDQKTRLALSPIAKFCRGFQKGKEITRCKMSTSENPFGQFILGSSSEQCWHCSQGQNYAECLYKPPRCNGYDVVCKQEDFAGNICCGLFALYVTRFCEELKVGTAFLPNVVGRLLEQGPASALVLYPIDGILNAHILEKAVKYYLEERVTQFEAYGITKVFRESPPAEEKLRYFLANWNKRDELLLQKVHEVLSQLVVNAENGRQVRIREAHSKICNFAANYIIPPERLFGNYLEEKPLFSPVEGSVVGMRGSFLFLDSGDVVDLKRLQGYVMRGKI